MTTRIRQFYFAVAFAATAAAGITGATLRGETAETDFTATCADAAWPMIPAECLNSATDQKVRLVTADKLAGEETATQVAAINPFADRFATAFE